jgi:hypothetical protein
MKVLIKKVEVMVNDKGFTIISTGEVFATLDEVRAYLTARFL